MDSKLKCDQKSNYFFKLFMSTVSYCETTRHEHSTVISLIAQLFLLVSNKINWTADFPFKKACITFTSHLRIRRDHKLCSDISHQVSSRPYYLSCYPHSFCRSVLLIYVNYWLIYVNCNFKTNNCVKDT